MTKKTSVDPHDTGCDIQTPSKQALRVYARGPCLYVNLQALCTAMKQDPQALQETHAVAGMVHLGRLDHLIWSHDLLPKLEWAERVSRGYEHTYSRLRTVALTLCAEKSPAAQAEFELYGSGKPDTIVNAILKATHPSYTPGIYPKANKAVNAWLADPGVMAWYVDTVAAATSDALDAYRPMPDLCAQLPDETPAMRPLLVSASEQASILAARAAREAA